MIELTMSRLIRSFGSQWAEESDFVGVLVDIAGIKEVIINSKENYEAKLTYYQQAYGEDLFHKKADKIRIVGWSFGNTFEEIQADLLG